MSCKKWQASTSQHLENSSFFRRLLCILNQFSLAAFIPMNVSPMARSCLATQPDLSVQLFKQMSALWNVTVHMCNVLACIQTVQSTIIISFNISMNFDTCLSSSSFTMLAWQQSAAPSYYYRPSGPAWSDFQRSKHKSSRPQLGLKTWECHHKLCLTLLIFLTLLIWFLQLSISLECRVRGSAGTVFFHWKRATFGEIVVALVNTVFKFSSYYKYKLHRSPLNRQSGFRTNNLYTSCNKQWST